MVTSASYDVMALKKSLERFDGSVVVEQIAKERVKEVKLDAMEMNVDNLLKAYAKQRNVDFALLMKGFSLIQ